LVLAKNGNLEGEELRQWLKRLQDEFVVRMQAIEAESALALAGREGTAESGEDSKDRPSVDQEDQAAEFPTNQGESASPAAEGILSSFATPQRPTERERASHRLPSRRMGNHDKWRIPVKGDGSQSSIPLRKARGLEQV
jgi:DNA mismatch repair protein MSH4